MIAFLWLQQKHDSRSNLVAVKEQLFGSGRFIAHARSSEDVKQEPYDWCVLYLR
jgi:hypothetical protein